MTFVYGVVNKIPKKVSLQLNKEEVDKVELAHFKIDRMQQQINAKNAKHSSNWKPIILLIAITALAYYYH